ncbi:MAG: hypothetical protein ACRDGD_05095, partial [Candidatus Limnocylindria bacterium]
MNSPAPVGRRGVGRFDLVGRLDTGTILTTLLVAGLVVRLFIASVYLPLSGFSIDVGDFNAWGQRLASVGPSGFYADDYFSDYPPGYLYVLWALGIIGEALTPLVGQNATGGLVKIPGILADVGVAWLLFTIAREWGGQLIARRWRDRFTPEHLGIAAATIYLFNPGTIFDSAVWGQIDSVGTLVVLAAIYALGRGWTEVAALAAVLAMLVKFQFALIVPIVLIVGIRRHLVGRSSDPAHDGRRDPLRVLTSLAVGVVSLVLLLLPFGMTIYAPLAGGSPTGFLGFLPEADPTRSLIGKLVEAAGTYTGITINAFNLWRNPFSGLGDTLLWGDDTAVVLVLGGIGLTWQHVGTIAFAVVAAIAFWQVARRDDMKGILVATLVLAIAFFVLPTRVHERYLFPALALAAPLVLGGRIWPWIYAGLSVSFFANIYWVYSADWSFADGVINPGAHGEPMARDPFLAATVFTDVGIWVLSAVIVVVLGVVLVRSIRLALAPAEPEPARAVEPMPPEPSRRPPDAEEWAATDGVAAEPRPSRGPLIGWLARNPADAYLREPTGRLGRRDALILLGLVVFALVFRLWRLDIPRGQHFDEVYHARSAAEWLSNWQNAWDRDVYEWTHPMLAKYLIAGGIVLADPNKVVDEHRLDAPASALAVAPRRQSRGWERSLAFTSTGGSEIVARDGETAGEVASWSAGGPIASFAYDPDGPRLLVGRADTGTVETYELAGLLASPDGRAPPSGPPITVDGLAGISEIVLPADADLMLLRGPDGVAVVERSDGSVRATATGSYGGIALVRGVDGEDGEDG